MDQLSNRLTLSHRGRPLALLTIHCQDNNDKRSRIGVGNVVQGWPAATCLELLGNKPRVGFGA